MVVRLLKIVGQMLRPDPTLTFRLAPPLDLDEPFDSLKLFLSGIDVKRFDGIKVHMLLIEQAPPTVIPDWLPDCV